MNRARITIILGFGLLLASNAFLLYRNIGNREESEDAISVITSAFDIYRFRYSDFGKRVPKTIGRSMDGIAIDSAFLSRRRGTILAFLSENACEPCAEHEVAIWDTLLSRYQSTFGIVLIANYPERERVLRLIKQYRFHYPIINQGVDPIFEAFHVTATPRVFLINADGKVLLQHFTRPDDKADLDGFYRIVESYVQ